jgi:hypothetical protein
VCTGQRTVFALPAWLTQDARAPRVNSAAPSTVTQADRPPATQSEEDAVRLWTTRAATGCAAPDVGLQRSTSSSRCAFTLPRLANMTRRGLVHDSASGPVDFSGPRRIFPFRSSASYEPRYVSASARLCASARVCASSSVHFCVSTWSHSSSGYQRSHSYTQNTRSRSRLFLNMQSVYRDWVVNRDHCSPKRPRHDQRQPSDTTRARRRTEERCV